MSQRSDLTLYRRSNAPYDASRATRMCAHRRHLALPNLPAKPATQGRASCTLRHPPHHDDHSDAPRNLDYYRRVLGLRLTAKTVNQDDPSVCHLFHGDELARPGADLTFFDYRHAIPARAGAGSAGSAGAPGSRNSIRECGWWW